MTRMLLLVVLICGCGVGEESPQTAQQTALDKPESNGHNRAFSGLFHTTKQPPVDGPIVSPLRLKGHTWSVNSVTFSPDGTLLATGGRDGLVCLWSLPSGQLSKTIPNASEDVQAVAFSPDGKRIATAGSTTVFSAFGEMVDAESLGRLDFTVKIWNTEDGTLHRAFAKPDVTRNLKWQPASLGYYRIFSANCVAFSPDGKLLASGDDEGFIRLWNVETGEEVAVLKGHEANVMSVAFSPNGKHMATGSLDDTVKIWDVATGESVHTFKKRMFKAPWSVCYSPNGKYLAAACNDSNVTQWDLENDCQSTVFRGHKASVVKSVAYSPDGKTLASGGHDRQTILWDVQSAKPKRIIPAPHVVESVAFSPGGRHLAIGRFGASSKQNETTVWDVGSETGVSDAH